MNTKYVFGLFLAAAGLLSAMHPLPARAEESPRVIISEINWAGSELSTADEWLRLYNAGQADVDASGFVLTGAATSGGALSLADGTMIGAGSTLLISNYPLGEKSVLTVPPDLVTTALSLPNSGLHIILAMADGSVLDEVNFGSTHDYGSTNPFTPAVRNLSTLEWESASGSEPPPAPPLEGGESITSIEVTDAVSDPVVVVEEIVVPEPIVEAVQAELIPEPATEPVVENVVGADPGIGPAETTDPAMPEIVIEATPSSFTEATEDEPAEEVPEEAIAIEEPIVAEEVVATTTVIEEPVATVEPVTVAEAGSEPPPAPPLKGGESIAVHFPTGTITISEIMSDPSEGNEWIELYNPGIKTIDLTDWFVTDATDKKTVLSGAVEAQNFFVVEAPKGKLNNTGDGVKLFGPSSELVDQMTYGTTDLKAPKKGQSLSFVEGAWNTTEPTKGQTNIQMPVTEETYDVPDTASPTPAAEPTPIQNDQPEPTENAADVSASRAETHRVIAVAAPVSTPAKKISTTKATTTTKTSTTKKSSSRAAATTKISGVVTALPGTFGEQVMFIDGIQVYANNKDWPTLNIGDAVTVTGTLSTNRGEQRIKIKTASDVSVTGSQESTAAEVSADQLSSSVEGRLVSVSGHVVERNGEKLTIEDGSGSVTIVAYSKTGISWQDLPSTEVRITGVVRHIDGQAFVYPRSEADVEFIDESEAPSVSPMTGGVINESTGIDWLSYLAYALLGGTLAALAFWFLRSLKNPNLTNQ